MASNEWFEVSVADGVAHRVFNRPDALMQTPFSVLCAIQEINIGMIANLGSLQRRPKLIPEGIAREYAYTGRRMTASRAFQLGLVNERGIPTIRRWSRRRWPRPGKSRPSRRSPSRAASRP